MQSIRHTSIIVAILCATTASADVTAQQVWGKWNSQMDVYGQGFTTGGETMSGDTLTVSDVTIKMSDDEANITATIGDINLTENGDGTVTITMADSYPIEMDFTPNFGQPSAISMTVSQDNMNLIVSGDPDAMVFGIEADRYAIQIDSITGGDSPNVEIEDAMIAMIDLNGRYSVSEDTLTRINYDFNIGALDIDVLFNETDAGGMVSGNADIADLAMFADIALPLDMDMDADRPPFADGLAIGGGYTFGNLSYAFDFDVEGDKGTGLATVESGTLAVSFDMDGASYTGGSNGIEVSVAIPNEIPFPLQASMAKYGFDFQIPLSQGEDGPRDARMAFDFTDLEVTDTLWNLFDPQTILPRDAVTFALGLNAKVTPFFDFLDPEQQEAAMMTDVPGELNSVVITELVIKGAGAEITGDGAFTFDNSDLQSFDGFPRPEGQVNFVINGVNGLVDNLILMGLIPEDEAMMPRMMMGMFTTPVGDDMLTSTIEVNSEGHVLANGQRLR
jgi:hypothetical protein